jgi:ubiquinone/menaquinone biosynthesis C-methylase UbiE
MSTPSPSNYVLGKSVHEDERLMFQARLLRPFTEKYFRAAGIVPGMRVLDIGSGMGDVALLAGDIVGPSGKVLGLDRDAQGLDRARSRAVEQGCSSWVSFDTANLDEFSTGERFDALVGRYILFYQSNPGATLRHLTQFLKPGGIVVFHELDFPDPQSSDPPCELWDRVFALLGEAFTRAGAPPHYGRRIATAFTGAGLPFPAVVCDGIIGGAPGSYVYPWIANTLVSVLPRFQDLGLTLPADMPSDRVALAQKLEAAVLASGSQLLAPTQYGAWTRLL